MQCCPRFPPRALDELPNAVSKRWLKRDQQQARVRIDRILFAMGPSLSNMSADGLLAMIGDQRIAQSDEMFTAICL
jgi:hypothetical protein